jgi:hypothetical protein
MLKQLRRATLDRGVLGGSTPWLVLGVLLWSLRALRLATKRDPGVVWRGTVADGETLVLASRTARQRSASRS